MYTYIAGRKEEEEEKKVNYCVKRSQSSAAVIRTIPEINTGKEVVLLPPSQ